MSNVEGIGIGTGNGLAIGIAMRESERTKQRRLSNVGRDQVLIETKMGADSVGNVIANCWENTNWYYNRSHSNTFCSLYHLPLVHKYRSK